MKRVLFLTPFALAAMAGCAPAPNQIQAGQWEIITVLRKVETPGAPAELVEQAQSQLGREEKVRACLSDEEARTFVQTIRRGQPATCRVTDEVYANGRMQTRVSCPGPDGRPASQVALDGNFTNTTFNATINEERPNPLGANQGPVRRTIALRGRRLGTCPATPTAPAAGL